MEIPSVVLDGLCSLGELDNTSFASVVDGVYDVLSGKTNTQVRDTLICNVKSDYVLSCVDCCQF